MDESPDIRPSGLGPSLPTLRPGAHVAHVYDGPDEHVAAVVPFLLAGARHGERCLWVVPRGLRPADARAALEAHDHPTEAVEVRAFADVYAGRTTRAILDGWRAECAAASAAGYRGLRLAGDGTAGAKRHWLAIIDYESCAGACFDDQRMRVLCTYDHTRLASEQTLDLLGVHDCLLRSHADGLRTAASGPPAAASDPDEHVLGVLRHDIRSPLQVIELAANAMGSGHVGADSLSACIRRNVERIDRMLDDFVDHAVRRGHGLGIDRRNTDLVSICARVVEAVRLTHDERDIALRVHSSRPGHWDPDRMLQVVANLVDNAVRHGDDPIRVTLRAEADAQVLIVTNRGGPIAPHERERLFEPYARGRETRSEGAGLGLFSVATNVGAHGGSAALDCTPADTVRVVVRLPYDTSRD